MIVRTGGTETLFDDPGRAWEPYQPDSRSPWDLARVAHVHRCAGLGATWGQVERDLRRVRAVDSPRPGRRVARAGRPARRRV